MCIIIKRFGVFSPFFPFLPYILFLLSVSASLSLTSLAPSLCLSLHPLVFSAANFCLHPHFLSPSLTRPYLSRSLAPTQSFTHPISFYIVNSKEGENSLFQIMVMFRRNEIHFNLLFFILSISVSSLHSTDHSLDTNIQL